MAAARIGGYRKPLLAGHEELLGRASTPHWSQPRSCAALRSYILLRIVLTASPPRSVALCVTSTVAQKQYLEAGASQGSARSKLCEAIRYPLLRWSGLTFFIDDGRIDLDQYRRALNPSVCAQPQERSLCWRGRRWGQLGRPCDAHGVLEAQPYQPAPMAASYTRKARCRSPRHRHRQAHAVDPRGQTSLPDNLPGRRSGCFLDQCNHVLFSEAG
jgi:hypothetical protein